MSPNAEPIFHSRLLLYGTSLVIGPLGNSILTYFLATALLNSQAGPGALPLKEIPLPDML